MNDNKTTNNTNAFFSPPSAQSTLSPNASSVPSVASVVTIFPTLNGKGLAFADSRHYV